MPRPSAARASSNLKARSASPPIPPLLLAALPPLAIGAIALFPRAAMSPSLQGSVAGAAALLVLLLLVLTAIVRASGRRLTHEFVPVRVHYVQAAMQGCVYAYWGWYWREVYDHIPLIAAQVLFAYGLDMIVSWLRRDRWVLGFGPFPIIFSTNLFMWFRDDWFFLQFAMVATGVLGKEFIKWERDGRQTHVFNPSALSLFLFSLALIATDSTGITWGPEIAATLGLPPYIYVLVFGVGLVVQGLFAVTLVTLSATAALVALNLAYTGWTGTYHFMITNIPIAVFLGLHLLVTDPATSPRTTVGKIIFGALYGASSFALFGLLGRFGIPTFYDKLLCVPILNLTVRWLDRLSYSLAERARFFEAVLAWKPGNVNVTAMAVWIALFVTMAWTGFVGADHPARDPAFWRRACDEGRRDACATWARMLEFHCRRDGRACNTLGALLNEGRLVERNAAEAAKSYARACNQGVRVGCESLKSLVRADGREALLGACNEGGDGTACFVLAQLHGGGFGVAIDKAEAFSLFEKSCAKGWARGCARLGDAYLSGEGTAVDAAKALASLDEGCKGGDAESCAAAAGLYERGTGTGKNESLAALRKSQACRLGLAAACRPGERVGAPGMIADGVIDMLKMGG